MNGPVSVAGIEVAPGERRDLAPVASESYTGDRTTLPMAVVNGGHSGARLFVTAAVHGDELVGTAVCRSLLADIDPATLRGTLVVVPIVNVLGAQIHSRYLPDRRDLNRSFPGSRSGSMASRIARLVLEEVVRGSDAGLDLHTAARHRTNIPQTRVDPDRAGVEGLARAFGAPHILKSTPREGSLRAVAGELDVPVVTYEAGEPLRFDAEGVAVGTAGVKRVMAHLGMLREEPPPPAEPRVLEASRWVRAERGGILDLHVAAGEDVVEDQPLWTTTSALGAERATIHSPDEGVVIGATTLPLVAPGDAILHIGRDATG